VVAFEIALFAIGFADLARPFVDYSFDTLSRADASARTGADALVLRDLRNPLKAERG